MEKDKYISLADSNININGSEKAFTEIIEAIQDGKELSLYYPQKIHTVQNPPL